ncbi:MAG: helix-turn-helix domain-containing protein [Bacteroidetes bacterium]|nr:helix-turn-helix domain-containing protein [Bacteroidota bacterium]
MYSIDLGFKIKKLRESKMISQEQLTETLHISQSKLSKIENGRIKKIDFVLMQKICTQFNITTSDFLEKCIEKKHS